MESVELNEREKVVAPLRRRKFLLISTTLVLLLSAICAAACYWMGWIKGTDRAETARADALLRANALDPRSVELRDTHVGIIMDGPQKGHKVVCGEYNAKNAHGAYAGFSRFIVVDAIDDPYTRPIEYYSKAEAEETGRACSAAALEAKRNPYSAINGKFECERAVEMATNREVLERFDFSWSKVCTKTEIYTQ